MQHSDVSRANAVKDYDRRLVEPLMQFSRVRLGPDWLNGAFGQYTGSDETIEQVEMQLAVPWALFHYPAEDDRSAAALFAGEQAWRLAPKVRAMLDAQLQAWLGVWEVQRVEPGVGMTMRDLLSGEERYVHEITGSRGIAARDAILGRVVDSGGVSFLSGIHPQPLQPRDADLAVREVRRVCRVRTRPIGVERLRDPSVQLNAIGVWRQLAARLREPRPMPTLSNTDGDPLAMTTDHFDIVSRDTAAVLARMSTFTGAEVPDPAAKGETSITITKPGVKAVGGNTVIGRVVIVGGRMRVESNSLRRADALRRELTAHLGALVRFRLRDQTPTEELFARASAPPAKGGRRAEQPADIKALLRDVKERHMMAWLDDSIPALGGLTPREAAVKSAATRRDLDLLLRDFENHEARAPADERFDVWRLRVALGLPAPE